MKRLILLLTVLSGISGCHTVAAVVDGCVEDMREAHLALESRSIDLGVLDDETPVEHLLRFRNTGEKSLLILSIFSDCGCTTTEYTADAVEPEEEGEIRIRFNPGGRSAGGFRKVLRIRSTAENSRETIIIKGEVDPNLGNIRGK